MLLPFLDIDSLVERSLLTFDADTTKRVTTYRFTYKPHQVSDTIFACGLCITKDFNLQIDTLDLHVRQAAAEVTPLYPCGEFAARSVISAHSISRMGKWNTAGGSRPFTCA